MMYVMHIPNLITHYTQYILIVKRRLYMAIKYVLFDFDGTLIDSNEAVISMLHLASEKQRGVKFTDIELDEILGKPILDQMAFLSEDSKEDLVEFYRAEYRKVRDALTKSYEGIDEMLHQIKALGLKVGIVSNKGRSGIDHGLDMFNMNELIDVSVSKDDVVKSKPDPEGIFTALRLLGADESAICDTIFVGDSGHDIESGKRAGCRTILVGWTLIDMEKLLLLEPDFIAKTPDEITAYIASNV
jgi:pyrophosphatase PpaX